MLLFNPLKDERNCADPKARIPKLTNVGKPLMTRSCLARVQNSRRLGNSLPTRFS